MSFTAPRDGRLELLIQMPERGMAPGKLLTFRVEAVGPSRTLSVTFAAEVVEPPAPRRVTALQLAGAQRKPPYDLNYIDRTNWESESCWGNTRWSENDPAAFQEPSAKEPLKLIINEDFGLFAELKAELTAGRKLAESTINTRKTHYATHVAYHLWQMYQSYEERRKVRADDGGQQTIPSEADQREEIQRVAGTLLRLMRVTG